MAQVAPRRDEPSAFAAQERKLGWPGKLALIAFGVILALLLGELYLRSPLVPERYRWELLEAWAPARWWLEDIDPALWHRLPSGLDVVIREPGGIAFRLRTTSLGFTGIGFREDSTARSAWAVAVGDSFTMGWGVELGQTWLKQLQKRSGHTVLNLGIAGTCPSVYVRVLERYGLSFQPQVVFYQIYVGNDLEDEWSFLQWRRHPWLARMHLFGKRHSYLYVFFQPRLRQWLFRSDEPEGATRMAPADQILEAGWALARSAILEARKVARERGASFVVLLVPAPEAVRAPSDGAETRTMAREGRKRAMFLTLCQAEGLDCVDLQPALQEAARRGQTIYLGDRHFSVEANTLVGEILFRWLEEHGRLAQAK